MDFTLKKGSEKGSQKGGASRRCPERPLGEYDPSSVRPKSRVSSSLVLF